MGDQGDEWEFERIGTEREKLQVEKELQELRERLAQVDEWKKRQAERLFAREKEGGWIVIEGYRRRLGPKEGEVWVTFEEMRRMKRQEAEGGG